MNSVTVDEPAGGPENMARDLGLVKQASEGRVIARVYSWDGLWVSLGRFQTPESALVNGFDSWVSRPTGGKAVLHGHDVTVGLAMPFTGRSVKDAYCASVSPLLRALRDCCLPAVMAAEMSSRDIGEPRLPDCFATASPYDVIDERDGQKVCGCAMRVFDGALLLQASIPYTAPLIDPASAIIGAVPAVVKPWNHADFPEALRSFLE